METPGKGICATILCGWVLGPFFTSLALTAHGVSVVNPRFFITVA